MANRMTDAEWHDAFCELATSYHRRIGGGGSADVGSRYRSNMEAGDFEVCGVAANKEELKDIIAAWNVAARALGAKVVDCTAEDEEPWTEDAEPFICVMRPEQGKEA